MNQEPTQAVAKRVEQAAEKHVKVAASGLTVLPTEQWKMFVDGYLEAFTAGVEWATTDPEMMKAMLQPFAEWCDNEYFTIQNSSMAVTKYIQFITDKQKEDGKI